MAFLIFKKEIRNDKVFYVNENRNYQLGGYGLIYKLWEKQGNPVNQGWPLTVNELLNEHNKEYSDKSHSLVIDFHPSSTNRIGLVEIEKIHVYTFGKDSIAFWSPMMIELKDVFYEEFEEEELTQERKQKMLSNIEISVDRQRILEFLYFQGQGWNWGRNGNTNAAFIHDEARKYFKQFF